MIELFEQNIKTNDRQSSKGNQLKWENSNIWYKSDYTGYEGLTEYVISRLLQFSDLNSDEYILYTPIQIKYKTKIYNGVYSHDFLKDGYKIITLERLWQSCYGSSLNHAIWTIRDPKERLEYIVTKIENITGLQDFGKYLNKILTIDMMFLNEDRHTHNLAVIMSDSGEYEYCPIFDNGAGLLADTTMDYPLEEDIYKLIDSVKAKTISLDFEEQTNVSEILYGENIHFKFTKKDVEDILNSQDASIYPIEIRERVKKVIYEQMRKYPYLF
ncbi:MAG: hypothetical protein K6A63_04325 [Acholeplasmatales bacterium]|nr:hypothetical protein [Acholeplasmatales bacterium]